MGLAEKGCVMNREERENKALSTEVRAVRRRGVLWEAMKAGCRLRRERTGEILVDIGAALVAFLLAMSHAAFGVYPFSLALLLAASTRVLPVLVGGVIGCTFLGESGVLYLALHLIAFAVRLLLTYPRERNGRAPDAVFSESPLLRVVVGTVLGASMGLYELILFGAHRYTLLFAAGATVLLPLCTLLYTFLVSQGRVLGALLGKEPLPALRYFGRHAPFLLSLGALFFLFTVAYSLKRFYFFGISLGACATAAATLLVSRRFGAARGCAAGLVIGLAGEALYLPAYGLLGLFAGLYGGIGMPLSLAAAVLSGGGYAAYVGGLSGFLSVIPEMSVTALLLSVPLSRLSSDGFATHPGATGSVLTAEPMPAEEASLACLSGALRSVSDRLKQAAAEEKTPSAEEFEALCLTAKDKICRRCPAEGSCGECDAVEESLRAAVIRLSLGESLGEGAHAPCEGYGRMLEEIRRSAAALAQRKRQGGAKGALSTDYALLSEMLEEIDRARSAERERDAEAEALLAGALAAHGITADEITVLGRRRRRITLVGLRGEEGKRVEGEWVEDACVRTCGKSVADVRFSYNAGVLSATAQSKRGYAVDGGTYTLAGNTGECAADAAATLTSENGFAYALLCDGMGSGRGAALAASLGVSVLSDLLSANVSRSVALALLNNAFCSSEEECSVALDLLSLDLYEGRAGFLKSGAAASFVYRDGALFRIRSRTIPLGLLRIVDSEEAVFDVRAGDVMVLLSDGVLGESEEGNWLKDVLASGGESRLLAKRIVEAAEGRASSSDDKTATVLRVLSAD